MVKFKELKECFTYMKKLITSKLSSHIELLNRVGMTKDSELDSRADLVRFFGISLENACIMLEHEVYSIIDLHKAEEDGEYYDDGLLPIHIRDNKCCGTNYRVNLVDCETRGDCEIYLCECPVCGKKMSFNYCAEWYMEPSQEDKIQDELMKINNRFYESLNDTKSMWYRNLSAEVIKEIRENAIDLSYKLISLVKQITDKSLVQYVKGEFESINKKYNAGILINF